MFFLHIVDDDELAVWQKVYSSSVPTTQIISISYSNFYALVVSYYD